LSAPAEKPQIVKLRRDHAVDSFDCAVEPLNTYLKRFALPNQTAGGAQTYVAELGKKIAGYYSLAAAQVEYADAPAHLRKGMARHPLSVILLARLAVDHTWQGKGLGAALLADALRRIHAAADIVGVRAVIVHAKDEGARRFYEHFDFDPSPVDPLLLFLPIKEIARLMR
jgi:GNAT superfamily N-acetyltransferase